MESIRTLGCSASFVSPEARYLPSGDRLQIIKAGLVTFAPAISALEPVTGLKVENVVLLGPLVE
jgi:hypothetical protein